jgi:hypothetical protein
MLLEIAAPTAGALLILLVSYDMFMTVLHPHTESPVSTWLERLMWALMSMAARPLKPALRHQMLGLAMPIMIAAMGITWILGLLLGFAAIFFPWIHDPQAIVRANQVDSPAWADAVYYSGVNLSTLGYGDFQPLNPALRFVAMLEGFSGIAVLSMSIAYVLEVYPVLQRKRALAVLLNEETAGRLDGVPMLTRYLRRDNFAELATLLRTINLDLLYLAEAHRRLPVLHFTHPPEPELSFHRVLLVVRGLVGSIRYGMAGGDGLAWGDDPRVQDLEDSLFYTLYTLGSSRQLSLTHNGKAGGGVETVREDFGVLVTRLQEYELPTPGRAERLEDGTPAWQSAFAGYAGLMLTSDLAMESYLRNSGYTPAELAADAVRPQRLVVELEREGPARDEEQQASSKGELR